MGAQPTTQMSSNCNSTSQLDNFARYSIPGQPTLVWFKQNQFQPYIQQQSSYPKSKCFKKVNCAELYHVQINTQNPTQFERQLNFYKIRQNLSFLSENCQSQFSKSLVSLFHFEQAFKTTPSVSCGWINNQGPFSQNKPENYKKQYSILIQKILYRLNQAKCRQFTFSQGIYIIKNVLKAYSILSDYGINTRTTLSKIGVKENGQIRVWVNENYSINGNNSDFCSSQEQSVEILVFQLSLILTLQERKKLRDYFQAIIQQIKKKKIINNSTPGKTHITQTICYGDVLDQLEEWELNEESIKKSIINKLLNRTKKHIKNNFYSSKDDLKIKQTNHSIKSSSTQSLFIRQRSESKKSQKQNFSFNGSFRKDTINSSSKKKKSLSLYRHNSIERQEENSSAINEATYHFKNVNQIQSIKADQLNRFQGNQLAWESKSIQQAVCLKNSTKDQQGQQIKTPKYQQRFEMASSIKFTSSIGQESCNNFSQLLLSKQINRTPIQNRKTNQQTAQNLKENILTSLHLSQSPDYVFSINQQSFSGQVSFIDHHFDSRKQMQLFPRWQIQQKVKQHAINAFNLAYKKNETKNLPQFGLR